MMPDKVVGGHEAQHDHGFQERAACSKTWSAKLPWVCRLGHVVLWVVASTLSAQFKAEKVEWSRQVMLMLWFHMWRMFAHWFLLFPKLSSLMKKKRMFYLTWPGGLSPASLLQSEPAFKTLYFLWFLLSCTGPSFLELLPLGNKTEGLEFGGGG